MSVVAELERRNVYPVFAWGVVQIAAGLPPVFDVPDAAIQP
jgi:hypothetical protein